MNIKALDQISPFILKFLEKAGTIADSKNCSVFIVGGFVRDLLLKRKNIDIDIVIESNGIEFANTFAREFNGKVRMHDRFRTATIILENNFKIDIATARSEIYRKPASLPIVQCASIKQDLSRRDFTINAMAVKLNSKKFGGFVDYFNGRKDLEKKIIRVLHDKSFIDDPTRIFRAIRFEQRYGFKIEKHTEHLLKETVKLRMIERLTPQRLQNELILMLKEDNPFKFIRRMDELGILNIIIPGIKLDKDIERQFKEMENIFNNKYFTADKIPDIWKIYLLVLMEHLPVEEMGEVSEKFRFSGNVIKLLLNASGNKKRIINVLSKKQSMSDSHLYSILVDAPAEIIALIFVNSKNAMVKQRIILYLSKLLHRKNLINGNDLIKLGLKKGRNYKKILEEIHCKVIDGKIKSKKEAKAHAKVIIRKIA